MKNIIVARKIYPEDYIGLRTLVYIEEKTFIEVLEDLYKYSRFKIDQYGVVYYYQYEKRESHYSTHKSISIPIDFNKFLIIYSCRGFPAKQLLSAIIQDYILYKKVKQTST